MSSPNPKTGSHVWLFGLTWCASGLLEVNVSEVQHAGHNPEQIQLLCVVQADLLHGYAHPGEVAVVVQQRVLQRARLCVLRNQERKRQISAHLHLLHIFILVPFLTQLTSNFISLPLFIFTFLPTCSLLFLHFGESPNHSNLISTSLCSVSAQCSNHPVYHWSCCTKQSRQWKKKHNLQQREVGRKTHKHTWKTHPGMPQCDDNHGLNYRHQRPRVPCDSGLSGKRILLLSRFFHLIRFSPDFSLPFSPH